MAKRLFCCDSGIWLTFDSSQFEIQNTNTGGTDFFVKIKETALIDNVFLATDGQYSKASHYVRGYFQDEPESYYSIFHARYVYPSPCDKMECHFCYRLAMREEHVTPSMYFEVKPFAKQKEKG